jgi:DNA polymerase (family 10)
MTTNARIASMLHEMASMLELLGEQGFRVGAYSKAARAIEGLTTEVATMDAAALLAVDGIGEKMAQRAQECVRTGTMKDYGELRAKVPAGLLDVLAVPGLGPKTVRAMWTTLGVTNIAGLKKAIDDGTLASLPRMGEKAVQKIRDALATIEQGQGRLALGLAFEVAERVLGVVRSQAGVVRAEAAGSLRRGKETVGDLDIVACVETLTSEVASKVMHAATTMRGVQRVLVRGDFKASMVLSVFGDGPVASDAGAKVETEPVQSTTEQTGQSHPHQMSETKVVQVDVRVVPRASFGATMQYFTGSKEHNVKLRALAQAKGLTLNEWGLFEEKSWETYHAQGPVDASRPLPAPVVDCSDEENIYTHLGAVCVPPEMREDRGEFAGKAGVAHEGAKLDASETVRALVHTRSIRSELHSHTTASDGVLSIEELARAAHARGFHTIAVTDHSQSSTIARGLKPDRLRTHIRAVREVHAKLHSELGMSVLAGSEVDILADGNLDYADDLLEQLDVVVASPHASLKQESAIATKRLLKAIEHPLVHILGHPTGRIVNHRAGLEPAMHELIAAARENRVALEINSHWSRLDLRDLHVRMAMEGGALLAVDCDVHHPSDFDNLRFGVMTARRGWATTDRVVNTWDATRLHAWLRSKRGT